MLCCSAHRTPTHATLTRASPYSTPWPRLLHRLEQEQRRRHDEYLALMTRHKVELAALLGSGGGPTPAHTPAKAKSGQALRAPLAAVGGVQGPAADALPQWAEAERGALVPLGSGRRRLVAMKEEEEEEEWEEEVPEASGSDQVQQQAPAAGGVLPTPAAGERPSAAAARPRSQMMRRVVENPRAPAARKRGATDGFVAAKPASVPAAAAGGKRRAAGRRRGIQTDETEATAEVDSMAVDEPVAAGRKRPRRASAASAGKAVAVADGAAKRTRRG